jgi:hypothetical protein
MSEKPKSNDSSNHDGPNLTKGPSPKNFLRKMQKCQKTKTLMIGILKIIKIHKSKSGHLKLLEFLKNLQNRE